MPKTLARPPPLNWMKVVAGLIGLALASWFLGVFLDSMYRTQGSPWTIFCGITGSLSPVSVGIYLHARQPEAFHKFLRFFEALGTQADDESGTKIEANASGSARASAAVARDNANQINVLGDFYAGPPHMEVALRERDSAPVAASQIEAREQKRRRGQSLEGALVANTTVVLESGEYESWPIDAVAGDRLRGTIESDGTLNALLLSEDDYAAYVEDDDYEPENALGEDRKFIPINFEIPRDGIWYLVIEIYGKQNPRTVTLRVRHKAAALARS